MANGGFKNFVHAAIGPNGQRSVHLGQVSRADARRLRRIASRGSRGTARGRGDAAPKAPSAGIGGTDQ